MINVRDAEPERGRDELATAFAIARSSAVQKGLTATLTAETIQGGF